MSQFTLALIEALKYKIVSESLSKSLTIQIKPLIEQIDDLKQHVIRLEQKDNKIAELENKVDILSPNIDSLEQYWRRVNIRVDGIDERPNKDPMGAGTHLGPVSI